MQIPRSSYLQRLMLIPDRSEIWANEVKNRESMKEVFGLEFPEEEQPKEEAQPEQSSDDDDDELPFGE